jgi:GLPGLI family protein
MRKLIIPALLPFVLLACNNEAEQKAVAAQKAAVDSIAVIVPSAKDSNVIILDETGKDSVNNVQKKQPFTEGVLTTTITFPGSKIDAEMKNEAGEFDMNKFVSTVMKMSMDSTQSKDDKAVQMQKMMNMMSMALLPLRSKVYYTKDKLLYKGEAMSYRYQNVYDNNAMNGEFILMSRKGDDRAAFIYTPETQSKIMNRQELGTDIYTITDGKETRVIGGYKCRHKIFVRKPGVDGAGAMSPERMEIWYTDEIPALLNMDQAFRVKVEGAILRSEIVLNKASGMKMVYQVSAIEPRAVKASELAVPAVAEKVDMSKDPQKAGMIIMRIMLGGSLFGPQ